MRKFCDRRGQSDVTLEAWDVLTAGRMNPNPQAVARAPNSY